MSTKLFYLKQLTEYFYVEYYGIWTRIHVETIAKIDREIDFNDATVKTIAIIDREIDFNDATVETIANIE